MKRLLTILLLATGTAYGQIDNPPSSVNIVDSTATGRALITATNPAAAATAVELGTTDTVTFSRIATTSNGSFTNPALRIGSSNTGLISVSGVLFGVSKGETVFSAGNTGFTVAPPATFSTNVTVSGNATLNGVANLAPAQTADSSDSLMTRGLSDNNPLFALGSVRNMGAFSFTNSGAASFASANITTGGAFITSGTGTNAFARASLYRGINDNSLFTGAGIRFTQNITVAGIFAFAARTNLVYRIIVGGNGGTPASGSSDALTTRGFGVEIDDSDGDVDTTRMRLFAHNGTTYTNSAYTGAITNNFNHQNHIILRGRTNGHVDLFLSVGPVNKAPSRPSSTPLLTLEGGPTDGNGLGFVDMVVVTLTNTAATSAGSALFYNGMVEVKD